MTCCQYYGDILHIDIKDCKDSLAHSRSMIKHWKNNAHLWVDLKRKIGKEGEFGYKKRIWVAHHKEKKAYVMHPSWHLITSPKIRAMCITYGCTHVCALNGLQCHMKSAHMKREYTLCELELWMQTSMIREEAT